MKIKLQADANLSEDILKGVLRREPGIDFLSATSAGLRGLSDTGVLSLAAAAGRILVSHDRKTMPRNFAEFIRSTASPGLFIISQKTDALAAIEGLLLIWSCSEAEEWINRICSVPL